ncbi:hypothetical protein LXM94_03450 [Rhizobium sp. TRM95111]|uniref:hypothetical protein n=1 Tax=Rhizobium alarense TaxID=2846851 RepID=UPI001F41A1CD|nr:hypothetical protein [Rhizobium alarense]MCF3639019.1 hypothetical protein [Rhizobium alarense]
MAEDKETGKRGPLGVVSADTGASKAERAAADREAAEALIADQIDVLREEIARMKESLGLVAEGTGQLAAARISSLREEVRNMVHENPFAALAGAAFVGYLFGLRHR